MKQKDFDPMKYIEDAFLDKSGEKRAANGSSGQEVDIPSISDYLQAAPSEGTSKGSASKPKQPNKRFRKTELSAPRPRKTKKPVKPTVVDDELKAVWESLPKNLHFLLSFFDDSVTGNYYRGEFKESRETLIRRLLDPELNLEEASRLLGVCPATVRRYTNRGWLSHHRTKGGQRRFRLRDIVRFVEEHGRLPEE
ncbi:MAG: hypothetical protein AMXMBFR19_13320 [Chthonomonadaceae bacterium]|uniref:Helix-turn-helix domain-containing protein n=1 Tax=Candidatus Nitrosymbiomonas proteolyticus TaxID=2608984 RepID=A0A809R554_9BACT|nr:helix-turn-helix domain-containing protein [Fimbriimonadaceae bacterium]BBO22700.1 conserved hypothetical protein [Candidatus Nitrosymbiomonas proteolyticus]GIK31098.1 MAG: hypothetical protein BroJett009_00900 [Armatimonadota bacterium]